MQSVEGRRKFGKKVRRISFFLGEVVSFPKTVRPRGVVEQWLTSVEQAMYDAMKYYLKVSLLSEFFSNQRLMYPFQLGLSDVTKTDYIEWIVKHHGQVVLTISQVLYTRQVNQTFDLSSSDIDQALIQTRDQMIGTINNVCSLVFTQLEPTKLLTVEALLTLQVHWRDSTLR